MNKFLRIFFAFSSICCTLNFGISYAMEKKQENKSQICLADESDLLDLNSTFKECFPDRHGDNVEKMLADEKTKIYKYVNNGVNVTYAIVDYSCMYDKNKDDSWEPWDIEVLFFFTHPKYQKKGFGSAFFSELIETIKKENKGKMIHLNSTDKGIGLYKKFLTRYPDDGKDFWFFPNKNRDIEKLKKVGWY